MLTTRSVGFLGTFTLAMVLAAGISITWRHAGTIRAIDTEIVFGDMAKLSDVVREVRIEREETNERIPVTIKRGESGWVVVEKADFPAETKMVRQLLLQLGELRKVEAKTRDVARFDRLELRDLSIEGSLANRLVLLDGAGEPLMDVLFGKRRSSISGGAPMTYMRTTGDTQTWLVEGELDLRSGPVGWIDQSAVNVPRERMLEARFRRPDMKPIVIKRQKGKDKFKILDMPADRREKSRYVTKNVVGALDFLLFEDVRPASELTFDANLGRAEFYTRDGLRVVVEFAEDPRAKNRPWSRFKAEALDIAEDEVKAEAVKINTATATWAYRLGDIRTDRMRSTLEAVTEPKKRK